MYTILFAILAFAIAATWLVPGGRYATVRYDAGRATLVMKEGDSERLLPPIQQSLTSLGVQTPIAVMTEGTATKPLAVPGTYVRTPSQPQGPLAMLTAPVAGILAAADIIIFCLIIGGFIGIFNRSGAFDAGLAALSARMRGREHWLIVVLTLLFGLGGSTFGMAEETIAFYPLLVPVFLRAGYDRVVPVAVLLGGSQMGCLASTTNPFSVILASATIGTRWTDGIEVRALLWVILMVVLIGWTLRYAAKVRRNPALSLDRAGTSPAEAEIHDGPAPTLTPRLWLMLALFGGTFVMMIIGVSSLGWWFSEMSALFLGSAILAGWLQSGEGRISAFLRGAGDLLGVAAIIGMARAITVILEAGHIDATLIAATGSALAGTAPWLFLVGAYGFYVLFSLVNNSSSGTAVLTMPLLGPAAAAVGVEGSSLINAYSFGGSLLNTVTPAGIALASLAMAGLSYGAWLRFIGPLLALVGIVSIAVMLIAA